MRYNYHQRKFTWGFCLIFIMVSLLFPAGLDDKQKEKKLPKVGDIYEIDKAKFLVRGIGKTAFEYEVTKDESFAVVTPKIPGSMLYPLKKGQVIKIDPAVPMIYIDGKEDKPLRQNSYFMEKAKNLIFILLEYIRKQ